MPCVTVTCGNCFICSSSAAEGKRIFGSNFEKIVATVSEFLVCVCVCVCVCVWCVCVCVVCVCVARVCGVCVCSACVCAHACVE